MAALKIGELMVNADVPELIRKIKLQVNSAGADYFADMKVTGHNLMITCPFHAEGQERHPSFGINMNTGQCNCFTCHWSAPNLTAFICEIFGKQYDPKFAERWIKLNYNVIISADYALPKLKFPEPHRMISLDLPEISEEELDSYRYIHPYIAQRKIPENIVEMFDIGFDPNTDEVTFPLWDLKGRPVAVLRRSVNTKRFVLPEAKDKLIYLANKFLERRQDAQGNIQYKYSRCVITESCFNALSCWRDGMPAVALLGTGSTDQIATLRRLPVKEYVLGLDPDTAGRLGEMRIIKALRPYKQLSKLIIPEGKDLNDLEIGEINKLSEEPI